MQRDKVSVKSSTGRLSDTFDSSGIVPGGMMAMTACNIPAASNDPNTADASPSSKLSVKS